MKQNFKLLLVALIAVFTIDAAIAQNQQKHRRNRQEFVQIKAKHIADKLNFDETTAEKFVETYCACEKEIWDSRPDFKPDQTFTTDADAEAAIMARFEHGQKILDIRRKYYEVYKTFLTPIQIEKVYSYEVKTMNQLNKNRHQKHNKRNRRGRSQKPQEPQASE